MRLLEDDGGRRTHCTGGLDPADAHQLGSQIVGVVAVAVFVVLFSFILWSLLEYSLGLRVSLKSEKAGLDISEHGLTAYPEFSDLPIQDIGIENSPRQEIE